MSIAITDVITELKSRATGSRAFPMKAVYNNSRKNYNLIHDNNNDLLETIEPTDNRYYAINIMDALIRNRGHIAKNSGFTSAYYIKNKPFEDHIFHTLSRLDEAFNLLYSKQIKNSRKWRLKKSGSLLSLILEKYWNSPKGENNNNVVYLPDQVTNKNGIFSKREHQRLKKDWLNFAFNAITTPYSSGEEHKDLSLMLVHTPAFKNRLEYILEFGNELDSLTNENILEKAVRKNTNWKTQFPNHKNPSTGLKLSNGLEIRYLYEKLNLIYSEEQLNILKKTSDKKIQEYYQVKNLQSSKMKDIPLLAKKYNLSPSTIKTKMLPSYLKNGGGPIFLKNPKFIKKVIKLIKTNKL